MTDGLKDVHREAIIAALAANDRVERAVLFGSRATGTNAVSSDVDIALFGNRLTLTDQARLAAALDEIPMAQSVDLLLYDSIRDRTLLEHILKHGVQWYARANPPRRLPLRDLCEAIVDCPHSTPAWTPDGVVVLRSKNIRDGRLDLSQPSYTSEQDYRQRTKRATPRAGDLVITREAPMGEVCLIPVGLRCCLGQRMVLLRPCLAATEPRYLLYALQSEPVQQEIRSHDGTGSTVSNLRISLLEDLRIPSHALSAQRAIAHFLGTLDDKIELNRRMNATLEAMARALFRSWFVDFDPVRAKMEGRDTGLPQEVAELFPDRLVDSELGETPEGWFVGTVSDVAEPSGTAVDPTSVDQDTPYIGLEHMPRQSVALTDWGSAGGVSSNKSCFSKGNVLFGKLRPYFHKVGIAPVNGVCSTDIVVLAARMPELSAFVLACVSSSEFVSYTNRISTGTKMPRTSWRSMSRYELCQPAAPIAEAFQCVAGPMLARIVANVHESRILGALRDALLPKLVSGEMRVLNANKFAEASHDADKPCRSGPVSVQKNERRENVGGKITQRVQLVENIEAGILGAPPKPMSASEIVWSRRTAIHNVPYRGFSEARQSALLDEVLKWGVAHRHHAVLGTETGEPAGSGVCVTSGGKRGILTARHVLFAYGKEEEYRTNMFIGFAPPRKQMIQEQRRRQHRHQNNRELLGPFEVTGISLGETATVVPLQRKDKLCPDPGLPDIAIVVVRDDIEERMQEAAHGKGTAVSEPRWVDLDREDLVNIPYSAANNEDEMLAGSWLITGVRGERSDFKQFYTEMDGIAIDRIYKRGEYEYYGILVDEVGGRRAQSRSWKGTSGGGIWQQRLRPSGWRKVEQFSTPSLTPEDLEPPVLGGIAFFHETRKAARELRGDGRSGTAQYRGELYAHRIDGMLLKVIRDALRHDIGMAAMDEYERVSEETSEQGG